jgi:hypothetical protein
MEYLAEIRLLSIFLTDRLKDTSLLCPYLSIFSEGGRRKTLLPTGHLNKFCYKRWDEN